jgi:hypothetical protein
VPHARPRATRTRSHRGIRPVGEPEPPGIQARDAGTFYWLYAPVRFTDHAIMCIVQEDGAGRRLLETERSISVS